MGQFLNNKSVFNKAGGNNAAVDPDEFIRKQEFDAGMSGRAPASHEHTASEITDLSTELITILGTLLTDSDSIAFQVSSNISAELRIKSGGGLAADADGVYIDAGSGTGGETESHDPVTFSASNTIRTTLLNQDIQQEVGLADDGGIIDYGDGSGIGNNWGSGANQVPRGNHTHAGLHDAVTTQDSTSINLSLDVQELTADLIVKTDLTAGEAAILIDAEGVFVRTGSGLNDAAPGNHIHADANELSSGYLSPELYRKLTNTIDLAQVDQNVLFTRHDPLIPEEYVGGRYHWGHMMECTFIDLTAAAPTAECTLGIEIDGTVIDTISVPAGTGHAEVQNYKSLTGIVVEAGTYLRIISVSGTDGTSGETPENEPSRINVTVGMRPIVTAPDTIQINAGGPEVYPYGADQFYIGGSIGTTSVDPDTSGVSTPAPDAVYKTVRRTLGTPLTYEVTGLARGIDYIIRLHFCEIVYANIGDVRMNITVTGMTVQTNTEWDPIAQAGGPNVATLLQFADKADNDGKITVLLEDGGGEGAGYTVSIAALEFEPQL